MARFIAYGLRSSSMVSSCSSSCYRGYSLDTAMALGSIGVGQGREPDIRWLTPEERGGCRGKRRNCKVWQWKLEFSWIQNGKIWNILEHTSRFGDDMWDYPFIHFQDGTKSWKTSSKQWAKSWQTQPSSAQILHEDPETLHRESWGPGSCRMAQSFASNLLDVRGMGRL